MDVLKFVNQPFADLKVYALQADDAACGHYRVVYPMEFLRRGGAQVVVRNGLNIQEMRDYDIILAQRQYNDHVLDEAKQARYFKRTLLYEIDDNVHRVHANSPAYSVYKPGSDTVKGVQRFLQSCDGLFTSSPELASQYRQYAKRTWVLPNCIDFGIRDWEGEVERDERLKGKIVIGWAGSITHQDDWAPLKGVVSTVLAKYPETIFAIVSAYQTMEIFSKNLDVPEDRMVCLEPVEFEEYPKLPAQFDIGLVPVVNTAFNRAKSDLKPLEYGARRVPYVASTIAPYMRLHQDTGGQGGYVCDTADEWIAAISSLVENEQERRDKAEFMFTYVREERSGDRNAYRWAEAFREARKARLLNPELGQQYVVREKPGRNSPCPCGSETKYKKCCAPAWG
jgi:glycosyltransferase involved in cell wall biosynthesis